MGFFEAWLVAVGVGFGLFYGLSTLGREIRTGLVEAAKVGKDEPVLTNKSRKLDPSLRLTQTSNGKELMLNESEKDLLIFARKHAPGADYVDGNWTWLKPILQAVVARERELCAQACDKLYEGDGPACDDHPTADMAATAIRARI